jgi:hypothetical protein
VGKLKGCSGLSLEAVLDDVSIIVVGCGATKDGVACDVLTTVPAWWT